MCALLRHIKVIPFDNYSTNRCHCRRRPNPPSLLLPFGTSKTMDNTTINEGHIDPSACARSGLDPAVYDSHFTDGVQTKCAAGEYCLQPRDVPVANLFHRCMVCTLRMHSYVTCGDTYESFKSDHGIPSLPPYGQYMVARYADREEELHICGSCIEKFSSNNTSPTLSTSNVTPAGNDEVDFSSDVGPYEHAAGDETGADDDDDADTEVATITDSTNGGLVLPADPTQWSKDHWQHWVQTKMTWKDIRITLTSCNHTGASQSSPTTRVRGITVTATYEKPIVGVTVEHWRPIYIVFQQIVQRHEKGKDL